MQHRPPSIERSLFVAPSRAQTRRSLRFLSIGIISLALFLAIHLVPVVASAQRVSLGAVAEQVYQAVPNLPRENQYVSRETGEVASGNTFISRLLRYHTIIKGRPVNFRLDWKLTFADYLGANERIFPDTYPGADTLRVNPLAGDTAVIERLNRVQRDQLITAILVALGTDPNSPIAAPTPASPSPAPAPDPGATPGSTTPVPVPNASPAPPRAPRPGDAQLLLP